MRQLRNMIDISQEYFVKSLLKDFSIEDKLKFKLKLYGPKSNTFY